MVTDSHSVLACCDHFSQLLNVHGVSDVRRTEMHIAERLVPESSAFEEMAIEKQKRRKSPDIDQFSADLIEAGCRTFRFEFHKSLNSIWNKEELPEEWKESIILSTYKKGDKTDCSNYRGLSLLLTTYKIVSNILLSRLTPYAEEIIGDHQCAFRRKRSTTDHIFCIRQILEIKWEHTEAVRQVFIDYKKVYDSFRREVLCHFH